VVPLTSKQKAALEALLTSKSHAEAARKAGIGRATLWRYLNNPDFKKAYREARRQLAVERLERLRQTARQMELILVGVAYDETAPATARVGAAREILAQFNEAEKTLELMDIQERLEALEGGNDDEAAKIKYFAEAFQSGETEGESGEP